MKDRFTGFRLPNYTQVPDELFDKLLPDLVESELKVLLYIVRRTLGFKKRLDAISLKQLEKGIPGKDRGAGIGRRQIIRCLKCLEEKRIIRIIRQKDPKNINEINFYSLNFSEENGGSDSQDTTVVSPTTPRSDIGDIRVVSPVSPNNKQNTQQTDQNPSDALFERISKACFKITNSGAQHDFNPVQFSIAMKKSGVSTEVIAYVMEELARYKKGIKNFWGYGITVLNRYMPEHNLQKELLRHYQMKQMFRKSTDIANFFVKNKPQEDNK